MTQITELLNSQSIFPSESTKLGYFVREPIINATFGDLRRRRGRAKRISMKSLGWDVRLSIDGIYHQPLEYGVEVVMKIMDTPECVLQSLEFDPDVQS